MDVNLEKLKKYLIQKYGETHETLINEATNYAFGIGFDYGRRGQDQQQKVAQIDPETGKTLKIWAGMSLASRTLKINRHNIRTVAQGKRNLAGGYVWKFIN